MVFLRKLAFRNMCIASSQPIAVPYHSNNQNVMFVTAHG